MLLMAGMMPAQTTKHLLPMQHPLQDKNFYLLTLLEQDKAAQHAVMADAAIVQITNERQNIEAAAEKSCKGNAVCLIKNFVWTDEEMNDIAISLSRLAQANPAVRAMVQRKLRPSHTYIQYELESDSGLLSGAWLVCAHGINDVLQVYGEGTAPRYAAIDSMSIDTNTLKGQLEVEYAHIRADEDAAAGEFFSPSLKLALYLLNANHRDEAARHEPMEAGENRAAVAAIAKTAWKKYPYTAIVVPGEGPADYKTALDPSGRKRCELAVAAWRAGKAPFLIVSGGYVHPAQTKYSEAIEMKRAMVEEMGVPESAVIVDPHARHTTTNLRNAVREMYRYGMPMDRPALVVSDAGQIGYIYAPSFADRCLREMGVLPYRSLTKLDDTTLSFLPVMDSLQQDPIEPLDP
jgi:DUF218 domain